MIEQGTHVEAEVEVSKVEKEIAAAAKKAGELEQKRDNGDEDDDHDGDDQTSQKTITAIAYSDDRSIVTFTIADEDPIGYAIAPELQKQLRPAVDESNPKALAKALATLRDQLKPADKEIGLALRTLKTLLAKPTQ